MKTRYLQLSVFLFVLCILLTSKSFCEDPGIPDTVRFGDLSTYVTGPPYQGKAILPIVVFNDEPVTIVDIPLRWTGSLWGDSGKFVDERADYLINHYIGYYNDTKGVAVRGIAGEPIEPYFMPPGEGEFVRLYFSVLDTGLVTIDTTTFPWQIYGFVDTLLNRFIPMFFSAEFHIQPSLAGDANGDGAVDGGDVVFLINYLFREDLPPDFPEQGDINGDCLIGPGDIVYLINYLFRDGPAPVTGCSH